MAFATAGRCSMSARTVAAVPSLARAPTPLTARRRAAAPSSPSQPQRHHRHRCYSAADITARLAASLSSAEETEDVMLVADVLAEARVSGLSLPPASVEAGVRALANGGQFKRAAALFSELPWASASSTPLPDQSTVHALFLAAVQAPLAATEDAAQRADGARAVLDALVKAAAACDASATTSLDLSPAFNRVVRAYARVPGGERLDVALALLSEMVSDERVAVDSSTFGALAAACIDAGRAELAEEVLDYRDYL
jgi:hypothetical protein